MPTKVHVVEAMVFPVAMYGCESWTSWAPKNWCFWTVVLEKTLESLLDCKEIQPVHPKGDQFWGFIGRIDVEAETPILATWCEELTHLKRPWCWERLKEREEGDDRGWVGWMASLTQWRCLSQLWELVMDREAWRAVVYRVANSDWVAELKWIIRCVDNLFMCCLAISIFGEMSI